MYTQLYYTHYYIKPSPQNVTETITGKYTREYTQLWPWGMHYNFTQKQRPNLRDQTKTQTMMRMFHNHTYHLLPNQCTSSLTQTIDAPLSLVWSMVRRFDYPQAYKQFVKSCTLCSGGGDIGSIREVKVVSGLPAAFSLERLDRLDDDMHVMKYSIIGGDHKLANYRSTTTVHEDEEEKTIVVESYVVDVPAGSSKEDTCTFADTIIRCNLRSLAKITEQMAYK